MLRRISAVALRLPEEFDEKGKLGRLRVHGETSDTHASIYLEESLPEEGDDVARFTEITLNRRKAYPNQLTSLMADSYVTDDIGEMYGVSGKYQTFTLDDRNNGLSMRGVMQGVRLAARTVEDAKTLEYLSRPEASFSQLF